MYIVIVIVNVQLLKEGQHSSALPILFYFHFYFIFYSFFSVMFIPKLSAANVIH